VNGKKDFTAEKNGKRQIEPQRPLRTQRKKEKTEYWGKTETAKTTDLTARAQRKTETAD